MAIFNTGGKVRQRRVRRIVAALLAVAMLAAGLGTSHAVAMPGHAVATSGSAEGAHAVHHAEAGAHAGQHQAAHSHGTCDDGAVPAAKDPAMQHDHGCCASACFPAAVARDAVRFQPPHFDVLPVRPRADQAPALSSPNDLFRPPRAAA